MKQVQQVDIKTNEVDKPTSIPDGFPPKGQYTQKAIAQEFGFDPSGIEKYYLPEALEIYQVVPQVLKAGHLFTQTFYDLMFLMRQHRMREQMVINSAGQIVRHAPKASGEKGKPVLERNDNRMGKEQFRLWYWEQKPELVPPIAEDDAKSLPKEEFKKVEVQVLKPDEFQAEDYDPETSDRMEGNLVRVENMGLSFQAWKNSMIQASRLQGREIVTEMVGAMQEEVEAGMKDFFNGMRNAVSSK